MQTAEIVKFPGSEVSEPRRSPQLEDGFTRIANELYEVVNNAHACPVNARHLRVIHAIIRRTYGFNKTMDALADTQLAADTGIPRNKVNVAKHELLAMNVLKLSDDGRKIGVNKVYAEWDFTKRPERKAPKPKTKTGQNGNDVTKMVTQEVTKEGTHKRQKDKNTTADAVVFAQTLSAAFEVFYNAGLPKKDRKRAQDKFKSVAKRLKRDPMELAEYLADDIAKRIAAEQQGIDRLHPTTYLNNERWLDDIEQPASTSLPVREDVPACPHSDLLAIWDDTCGKVKGAAPHLLDWKGTKAADALAERWAEFYNVEVNGKVRYDSIESGLAWWRMALGHIAGLQDFRSADVDIWTVFYKTRFGKAARGQLSGQGGATR